MNPEVRAPSYVRRLLDATRFPVIKASEVRRRIAELQAQEPKPFVAEGDLVLWWEPGGDTWCMGHRQIEDELAEHFGVERAKPSGNRHFGRVRITVEKLPDADND